MRAATVYGLLLGLPYAFGLQTHGSSLTMSAPRPQAGGIMGSRRSFGMGLVLLGPSLSARAADKAAPGAVVGTWTLTQSGIKQPSGGELSFEKSGDATYKASSDTFQSVNNWRVDSGGRFFNDKSRKVEFALEYSDGVYNYEGYIEEGDGEHMAGTVSRDGGGGTKGEFQAELVSAAAFVKERPAFAKFEPSPDAPVLELNGRARWQVERERDGGVRPAEPIRNADEQSRVYRKLAGNPTGSLKGITGYH